MSIFKHNPPEPKEAIAPPPNEGGVQTAQLEKQAKAMRPLTPPAGMPRSTGAPGVVPPPAAPVYSMRPPELAGRGEGNDDCVPATSSPRATLRRPAAQSSTACHVFDPVTATQAGLLNLAWKWQEAGAPIRAIHTYVEILTRYPHSAGAEAAVADLVELSSILTEQGQFHTALAIYDHLEELLS